MTDLEGNIGSNNDKFSRFEPKQKWIMPKIDQQGLENIKNYKYVGGDSGYFYRHFWGPTADWIVIRLPEWFNPNTVSL